MRKKAEFDIEAFRPVGAIFSFTILPISNMQKKKPQLLFLGCRQSHILTHHLGEEAGAAGGWHRVLEADPSAGACWGWKLLLSLRTLGWLLNIVSPQEIEELMKQIYSAHVSAQSLFDLPDLAAALKQIQTQYDDIAAKNLQVNIWAHDDT